MLPWIIALYLLSALLPLFGLARLMRLAFREAQPIREAPTSAKGVSYAQVQAAMAPLVDGMMQRPKAIATDFVTIGAGVIAGCVASIMSLFI